MLENYLQNLFIFLYNNLDVNKNLNCRLINTLFINVLVKLKKDRLLLVSAQKAHKLNH